MCGIAALIRSPDASVPSGALEEMVSRVAHRGPDGNGHVYLTGSGEPVERSGAWRVALGHRRLSILDLSDAARQPMRHDGVWLTFNGEIYNFVELRDELVKLGHRLTSSGDSEVLLAAYREWGTGCFERLKGMWGLVLVDPRAQRVVVSRDRLGIKPLYRATRGGLTAFCSELKQLGALGFKLEPDRDALEAYLATGYEDQSRCFFQGVAPLPPGTWASYSFDGAEIASGSYWHPERVRATVADRHEAAQRLVAALRLSVKQHLRSDVPVGCALSGGLDSTSVVALVAELEPRSLSTFTASFPGERVDERGLVEQALKGLPARAHWVTPTVEQFLEEMDRFVWIHDEPVGTLSQYAGWCVARLTRGAGVPVTLNGQGGDEVLSGYWQSYFSFLRSAVRGGHLRTVGAEAWAALRGGNREVLRQVPWMARRYLSRLRAAKDTSAAGTLQRIGAMSDQERRVFEIREMYLPRLLKWDDRNFMAFSVEGRYPFLDHELIETALSFDPRVLYRGGWVKEPLREAMEGKLPASIVRRRDKAGFDIPQLGWLRGPMKATIDAFVAGDAALWQFGLRERVQGWAKGAFGPNGEVEDTAFALVRAFLANRWLEIFFNGRSKAAWAA